MNPNPTPYQLRLPRSAEKVLQRLMRVDQERVHAAILGLADNPRPVGSKKLTDREEYSMRVGNYRISYVVDDAAHLVEIRGVGHRRDAYRHR